MNNQVTANARRLALGCLLLSGASTLAAQSLRVTASNSSAPNAVYDVLFSPAGTTLLNSDGTSFQRLGALTFVPGVASGVDLLAADAGSGTIVRYIAPSGTPTESSLIVWSAASSIPGPRNPDGLSVDAAGNVYVIDSVSNTTRQPSLWVLRPSASGQGGFLPPLLLDRNFGGQEVDKLVETAVVPNTLSHAVTAQLAANGVHPGDLLVLVADNDFDPSDRNEKVALFDYSASSIAAFLANPSVPITKPVTALLEHQFPTTSGSQSPLPAGVDIWPIDGSLLLSTNQGTVLQYSLPNSGSASALWTAKSATVFASVSCGGAPCPFNKLRTSEQMGTAYAFVTQSTGASSGNILQFSVTATTPTPLSGFSFTAPTAFVATSGFTTGAPQGIAVAPQTVVVASAAACASASGCNPTGGLLSVIVPGAAGVGPQGVNGNIVQQSCVITDTRLQANGTCPGTLNISQLCPGFPATLIPPTICGGSGPSHNQLAVIHSIANGVDDVPDILVQTLASPSALIPGATDDPCQAGQVLGWSPRPGSNEGTIPEGASLIDMTTFCDKGGGTTRGNSVWTLGGNLSSSVSGSTPGLIGFANQKLVNLAKTVQGANIARPVQGLLDACLVVSAVLLNTGQYACAARSVFVCDQLVAANTPAFGSSAANPNPFGDIRGRLGNLFYTINTRILRRAPNPTWPLTIVPPACR